MSVGISDEICNVRLRSNLCTTSPSCSFLSNFFYASSCLVSMLIDRKVCNQHGLKCSESGRNNICPDYEVVVTDTYYLCAEHKLQT